MILRVYVVYFLGPSFALEGIIFKTISHTGVV